MPQRRPHLPHFSSNLQRITSDLSCFFWRRWFQADVWSHNSSTIVTRNFMAAKTTVGFDELIPLEYLRSSRTKLFVDTQLRHVDVALDTARFLETLRVHRMFPIMVVEPFMIFFPLGHFRRIIGCVRSIRKRGPGPLPFMAHSTSEFRQRMRTGRV